MSFSLLSMAFALLPINQGFLYFDGDNQRFTNFFMEMAIVVSMYTMLELTLLHMCNHGGHFGLGPAFHLRI